MLVTIGEGGLVKSKTAGGFATKNECAERITVSIGYTDFAIDDPSLV